MPRKYRKRTYKRRTGRKSGKGKFARNIAPSTSIRSLSYNGQPFPPKLRTQFTYNWEGTLTSTSGMPNLQTFNLNSLYDPDQTGTGAQPRWRDTLLGANAGSAPYGSYTVKACKMSVKFLNGSTTMGQVVIGCRAQAGSAPNSALAATENPWYRVTSISGNQASTAVRTMSIYVPMHKIFGTSKGQDQEPISALSAGYGTNPSYIVSGDVFFDNYDTSTTSNCYCSVTLTFYAELGLMNQASQS